MTNTGDIIHLTKDEQISFKGKYWVKYYITQAPIPQWNWKMLYF